MQVYLNGAYVAKEQAVISVDDRGFIFGDGVYEVIRARNGRLFEAAAHLARLAAGVEALAIPGLTPAAIEGFAGIARELLRRNRIDRGDATVYIQVTRGAAPRTHHFPPATTPPTIYLSVAPFVPPTALHERGATTITLPDLRWARCDIKTVNLVPNVLAKQRAVAAGAAEAILLRDGAVTDGASTNVFAVLGGELRTPPLSNYLLPGVTRRVVLDLARALEIPYRECPVFVEDLARAEEVFLTGTTSDVMPVREIDGRCVGDGSPGAITRRLQEALAGRLRALDEPAA
jgi:D-alanine transaminase